MLTAAVDYATRGWAVLPCQWEGEDAKAPLLRHGFHDATTNLDTVGHWWHVRWPRAMVGAVVPDGLLVIDLDPRHGGDRDLLQATVGEIPDTTTVESGRGDGGEHLYFRVPPGQRWTAARLPDGIDVKAPGKGYCIMPPSIHPASGQPYRWVSDAGFAPLPPVLDELLTPAPPRPRLRTVGGQRGGDGHQLVEFLYRFPDKGINNALYWAACRARDDGVLDDLADTLVAVATSLGESVRAAERTVGSAWDHTCGKYCRREGGAA